MLSGKLTERVWLRVTEEMDIQIRFLAAREHRGIDQQLRVLIALGLSVALASKGKETSAQDCQVVSSEPFALSTTDAVPGPKAVNPVKRGKARTA